MINHSASGIRGTGNFLILKAYRTKMSQHFKKWKRAIRPSYALLAGLLVLSACGGAKRECGSEDVLRILKTKLAMSLGSFLDDETYYHGKKGNLVLEKPQYVGKSGEYTLCTATLQRIHNVDPDTGRRYSPPKIQTSPMPYRFIILDHMNVIVKPF